LFSDLKDEDLGFAGERMTHLDRLNETVDFYGAINAIQDTIITMSQHSHRKTVAVAVVVC